jgi:DNA-binding NarL/FixJ family response regulator
VPIRVAVGDDSLLVREGIVRLLEQVPQVEVVSVCSDFAQLLEAIDVHQPEVVLTDIRMPPSYGAEGIELADRLRGTHPETAVVVLSQYADPQYALRLFQSGSAKRVYLL